MNLSSTAPVKWISFLFNDLCDTNWRPFMLFQSTVLFVLCFSFSSVNANCHSALGVADDASRSEVIMGQSGDLFQIKIDNGSVLQGSKNTEFERRVNLSKFPILSTHIDIKDMPTLVIDLLDQFHLFNEKGNSGIYSLFSTQLSLRPLSSENAQHFHLNGSRPEKIKNPILNHQGLSLELLSQKQIILMGPEHGDGNAITKKYLVGRQDEESIYFDTPDGELQSKGIAVRVKSWYPFLPDGSRSKEKTGRSLFIKISKEQSGHFTKRLEINVPIALDMNDADTLEAINLLLLKEGVTPPTTKIKPSIRINNVRYGVDLAWRTSLRPEEYQFATQTYVRWLKEFKKIGFLTVDHFTAYNFHTQTTSAPTIQMEYEIFPEELALYNTNQENFDKFFKAIESRYDFVVDTRPKYIQGKDATK